MNTKEKVLAASNKVWAELDGFGMVENGNGWKFCGTNSDKAGKVYSYDKGGVTLTFDALTPDDDPVWPLAAQVLGIREDEKGRNYVKELLRQAFLQGRDTSGMPEKDALANFHRAEKEYYLPQFGNPQNLIDALQKIAADGNERDFDAAEFAEMAIEDWEQNGKMPFAVKSFEGPTIRQLLAENIRLLKIQVETPKPDWVKEEIKEMMRPSDSLLWAAYEAGFIAANRIGGRIKDHGDCKRGFETWAKSLPPDTLKEDRELVKEAFKRKWVTVLVDPESTSVEIVAALKRLCGMGVGG